MRFTHIENVIVAVSSASVPMHKTVRSIIRLSGAGVWHILEQVVTPLPTLRKNTVTPCRVRVCEGLEMDGVLYAFQSPHSYTGEDMAEIHLWGGADTLEMLLKRICDSEQSGSDSSDNPFYIVRPAGPGEFTLRAYLNGKMDLIQAEAVAQIVSSANTMQLSAAEKLLRGRFCETTEKVRREILEILSLIEAGLDFAEEDIAFISLEQAAGRIASQKKILMELLKGSVQLERMIDLDAVGLAGLPNAGKSSLLNALLGSQRSIVSSVEATTRDILTGVLELNGISCVLFDCAGLLPNVSAVPHASGCNYNTLKHKQQTVDELAQRAAVETLQRAELVLFCLDASKSSFETDIEIRSQIITGTIIPVATKTDLADTAAIRRLEHLAESQFDAPLCVSSSKTGQGLTTLKDRIESTLIRGRSGKEHTDRLTLNRRHTERLEDAVKTLSDAANETTAGCEETAAMLLRQCYEALGGLERENVSEKILDSIFSRFCIGK